MSETTYVEMNMKDFSLMIKNYAKRDQGRYVNKVRNIDKTIGKGGRRWLHLVLVGDRARGRKKSIIGAVFDNGEKRPRWQRQRFWWWNRVKVRKTYMYILQ
jgi:hypothetical protein